MPLPPIRAIGGVAIQPKQRASCHCGAVVLELHLPDGIIDARRSNANQYGYNLGCCAR
jgi:hypothetical protein